jgi:DNA adenine methylase
VSAPSRPVLRYHGGKWLLAEWIIGHFPPHRTYVEPFGGAGSVLMRKPRAYSEVYNDSWQTVVDVFRAVRDPVTAAELERRLRLTPFARDEFRAAYIYQTDDLVERARKHIVRSFMGFGSASTNGKHMTGFRAKSQRSGTTPALDWRNFPDHVKTFTERMQGVVIENKRALDVIEQHDGSDTLFYCDPPYPHETRNMRRGNACYTHEMTNEDHSQLASALRVCRGMVIVSSYPNALYARLFAGWSTVQCDAFADGARERREILFMNEAAASAQRQAQLPMEHVA